MSKLRESQYLKYIINLIVAVMVILLIAKLPFDTGLTSQAQNYLGILAAMIFMLISGVFDEHIIIMLTLVVCVLMNITSFSSVFSAFSGSTVWLLVGILPVTAVIIKSGLMNRISLYLLKIFPCSYKWQLLALSISALFVNPLIPSTTAKSSLIATLAASVSKQMKLEKKSKPMAGIFLSLFVNGPSLGHIFLSGSVQAIMVVGMMPEKMAAQFSWIGWLVASSVWALVAFVLIYFAILLIYGPKEPISLTKDDIQQMIYELGPITKIEKQVMVILIITLIGWVTKSIHNIPECVFAVLAYCTLFCLGAIDKKEFRGNVQWDVLIYVGGIICVANLFTTLGIDVWLADVMTPIVSLITCNSIVYIICLVLIVYVFRVFIVSSIATVTIFYVVFAQTAYLNLGISPFITGMLIIGASKSWPTKFTNSNYIAAEAIMGEDALNFKHIQLMSHMYILITIVAAIISIPFWKTAGLM